MLIKNETNKARSISVGAEQVIDRRRSVRSERGGTTGITRDKVCVRTTIDVPAHGSVTGVDDSLKTHPDVVRYVKAGIFTIKPE